MSRECRLSDLGSPPRMRGKPRVSVARGAEPGITPADAGKTIKKPFLLSRIEDHPRGCGENAPRGKNSSTSGGSPPRMRGKPQTSPNPWSINRITPADAGKTTQSLSSGRSLRDHPRGCGENSVSRARSSVRPGSPPRMRGKR